MVMKIFSSPYTINWNVTDRCIFDCKHCYTRTREKDNELNTEQAFEAIDSFQKANVFYINFGGGEPLVRKDIFDLMLRLKEKKIAVSLSTNGWLVNSEVVDKLKECKLNKVYISIDHSTSEVHDSVRMQEGALNKAIEAIKLLKNADIEVGFSTVVTKYNFDDLENIVNLAEELGVSDLNIKRFRPVGNGAINNKDFVLSENEEKIAFSEIERLTNLKKDIMQVYFLYVDFPIPGISEGCPCGKKSLAMLPNGNLLYCAYGITILGNILDDDLTNIWRNHPFLIKDRIKHRCEGLIKHF